MRLAFLAIASTPSSMEPAPFQVIPICVSASSSACRKAISCGYRIPMTLWKPSVASRCSWPRSSRTSRARQRKTMKAIILARGSTKAQEEGHSIAAQRLRLVDYCARKGLKVIKTYELVESSTRGERKEFAAMLAFAQAQNETVAIVADAVDRFQRSFKESVLICDELIRKEKVELHFHQEGTIIGTSASSMVTS